MFDLSHTSMIKVKYMSKWCNLFLSFVFHNDWIQNLCWLSIKSLTPNFVVVVDVLLPICCHVGCGMPYLCIYVEAVVRLLGAFTAKWL